MSDEYTWDELQELDYDKLEEIKLQLQTDLYEIQKEKNMLIQQIITLQSLIKQTDKSSQ